MGLRRRLGQHALEIFRAGLAAVDPYAAVARALSLRADTLRASVDGATPIDLDLGAFDRVLVVGAGKASARMALAVEERLGPRIEQGLILVKAGYGEPTKRCQVLEAGHPQPDRRGLDGARRIQALLEGAGPRSLVVALISGGGSALLPLPAAGIRLADKQQLTERLLRAGATISELNAVRKHLSAIKGGQLSRAAFPATVLSLVISDVVGDELGVIASGPTAADPSSFADARAALERHGLWADAPARVRARIEQGLAGLVADTPKPGDPALCHSHNALVATNRHCLEGCAARARALGYQTEIGAEPVVGEAREQGARLAQQALSQRQQAPRSQPRCWLSGGETTVRVTGAGRGGRNQELALGAALELDRAEPLPSDLALLSAGTDGTDHLDEAAGAIAFGDAVERARALGIDAKARLRDNDSFALFQAIDDLVVTGPTGTNVMDVQVVLLGPPPNGGGEFLAAARRVE